MRYSTTQIFAEIDTDANKVIDLEELKAAMSKLGVTLTDDEVQVMMKTADADGDGSIDLQEFQDLIRVEVSIHQAASSACVVS